MWFVMLRTGSGTPAVLADEDGMLAEFEDELEAEDAADETGLEYQVYEWDS